MKKISFKPSVMLNPVPAVMITSRNKEGKDNVFTVSWVNTICTRPPMLSISIRPERLSYEYIKESMEFIVNVPSSNLAYETDFVGVKTGKKLNKFEELNLNLIDGDHVNVGYIKECPISIECKVKQIIPLGSHDLFIADVLGSHVDENLLDEKGRLQFEKGNLITYAHGEYFELPATPIGRFGYSNKNSKTETLEILKNVRLNENVSKKQDSPLEKDLKKSKISKNNKSTKQNIDTKIEKKKKNFTKKTINKKKRTRI
ncbi:MAG: flavin reductase family protein [Sarcina sp.]